MIKKGNNFTRFNRKIAVIGTAAVLFTIILFPKALNAQGKVVFDEVFTIYSDSEPVKIKFEDPEFTLDIRPGWFRKDYFKWVNATFNGDDFSYRRIDYKNIKRRKEWVKRSGGLKCTLRILDYKPYIEPLKTLKEFWDPQMQHPTMKWVPTGRYLYYLEWVKLRITVEKTY